MVGSSGALGPGLGFQGGASSITREELTCLLESHADSHAHIYIYMYMFVFETITITRVYFILHYITYQEFASTLRELSSDLCELLIALHLTARVRS